MSDPFSELGGLGLALLGAVVLFVGLVWLGVDQANNDAIDGAIGALEAQSRNASSGVRVTPWTRDGAGGLSLSLPLP